MTRNNYLLRKFGITEEQYDYIFSLQGESCGVCKRPASAFRTRLCVDHDHFTGEVRGLLCNYCNRRIVGRHRSLAGSTLLANASKYLLGPYPGWIVPKKKKVKKKKNAKKLRARS